MRSLLLSILMIPMFAEDPAPAPLEQSLGVSSTLVLDRPLELSQKVLGFVKAETPEVVMQFDAQEIVSVHRFVKDPVAQSIIVIAVPLSTGRQDTFILIPDAVMPYDKLLEFVDAARRSARMSGMRR